MSLVRSLARRYSYRGEQLEDLVQIGAIGLIKAIDRFDLDRGVELTTYATPNIIGEIKRHFRDKGWSVRVPRGLQELNVQLSRPDRGADGAARPLADDRRAREGGRGRARKRCSRRSRAGARTRRSRSRPASGGDDDGELDPLESIGTEEPQYEVSEDRAVLAPGFRVLDERERMILHLRFFEGLTQSQIAQQVGISQMHVSRLIRRSLEKIREEIAADQPRRAAAQPLAQRHRRARRHRRRARRGRAPSTRRHVRLRQPLRRSGPGPASGASAAASSETRRRRSAASRGLVAEGSDCAMPCSTAAHDLRWGRDVRAVRASALVRSTG